MSVRKTSYFPVMINYYYTHTHTYCGPRVYLYTINLQRRTITERVRVYIKNRRRTVGASWTTWIYFWGPVMISYHMYIAYNVTSKIQILPINIYIIQVFLIFRKQYFYGSPSSPLKKKSR